MLSVDSMPSGRFARVRARFLCSLRAAACLAALGAGTEARGEEPPRTAAPERPSAIVSYVSELPLQWQSDLGNPLERWAQKLASEWEAEPVRGIEVLRNVRPEPSWDHLARTAKAERADVFMVHAYEYVRLAKVAPVDLLMAPGIGNALKRVQFVLVTRQSAGFPATGDNRARLNSLLRHEILVDRAGCGELVYLWLDRELRAAAGDARRDNFADFRTVASAEQAVLAVFFGETDACLVSRTTLEKVTAYNPGMTEALQILLHSPEFLPHVLACRRSINAQRRQALVSDAAGFSLVQSGVSERLVEVKATDLKEISDLAAWWAANDAIAAGAAPAGDGTASPRAAAPPARDTGKLAEGGRQ